MHGRRVCACTDRLHGFYEPGGVAVPLPEDARKLLTCGNKELMIIDGASHTDLYDRKDIIPFDKIEEFFRCAM